MIVDLRLQHFRSYSDSSFELSPGVNIIVGPNASGKTNLLEAILVLAQGSSYRVHDSELVQFSQPWARLDARLDDTSARTVKLLSGPKTTKSYEIEGKAFKRLTMAHTLPIVLFEPDHLRLLSGSPERRREYLDDLLEQTEPNYGTLRRNYKRALAQRNALLKTSRQIGQTELFPWNIKLGELGAQIVRSRYALVAKISEQATPLYKELAKTKTKVALHYMSRWEGDMYESNLLHQLEHDMELDRQRGFTGQGPHRDDLQVLFDGHVASETASRGETRTAILALKILELRFIEIAREKRPLLLLDDVFSELDGSRRRALTEYLTVYQTFITTTDADIVIEHFTESCNVIPLDRQKTTTRLQNQ